jgi:hypothetical protein
MTRRPKEETAVQAEALIWKHVPLSALLGICSCNADVDANVKTELQNRKLVLQSIVQRGWYF